MQQQIDQNIKKAIEQCIKYRQISYNRFLITKGCLSDLKHRKIVQKIFQKYIPDNNYNNIQLISSLKGKNQQQINENWKQLVKGIKYIPNNILNIKLDFSNNNLGDNVENLKYLGEVLKQVPQNLQNLELKLDSCDLGEKSDNLKRLVQGMRFVANGLRVLRLDLTRNNLGKNSENLKYFQEGMKYLPQNLKSLSLNLSMNNLGGGNGDNLKWLGAWNRRPRTGEFSPRNFISFLCHQG